MTLHEEPQCAHHEDSVSMTLRSLHTDVSRPTQLIGTFACPDCGHESRVPIEPEAT